MFVTLLKNTLQVLSLMTHANACIHRGPHKDNLTRNFFKKIFKKLSEETELRAPHL